MMDEKFLLPAGIVFAALCILGLGSLALRSRRTREQDKLSAEDREELAEERRKTWRRRLAVISLSVSFVIIFCIAGIAAWLSFGAQKAYAFDRNGGSWDAATGFALLLDAGALGLSLLRLFEALTARSSQLTRFYLVGFILASAVMNLLHTPHAPGESPTLGGRLVAVIPPLVYAIFLESLLKKVEQLVLGKYPAKKKKKNAERGYSLLLWVPFIGYPREMWKQWRKDLHDTLQYVRAPGSRTPLPAPATASGAELDEDEAAPRAEPQPVPRETPRLGPPPLELQEPPPAPVRNVPIAPAPATTSEPSRAVEPIGPARQAPMQIPAPSSPIQPKPVRPDASSTKKDLLRDALLAQIRSGDFTVLDTNAQVANVPAYRANRALGEAAGLGIGSDGKQEGLLKQGAVRTAVKQLLPELRRAAMEVEAERASRAAAAALPEPTPEPAPEHHAAETQAPNVEAPRERREDDEPTVGQQRSADARDAAALI
ncbi:DUF2637 domain-containing protein [Streptomyces microflavus]|uniref:DUF2637 domain-containing protein n=1 Tax=Streptomyces microflavus TaxID=1919 RepID=UPI0036620596